MAWLNLLLTVALVVGAEFWIARLIERNAPLADGDAALPPEAR